jgi:2-polyprenyl-3-methyl-5-hydroxy-6-metoxy-1,4-benzoquinol methylase
MSEHKEKVSLPSSTGDDSPPRQSVEDSCSVSDTRTDHYANRLKRIQLVPWKRLLDVQAPYRWNLRRLHTGFTLDVGCGIGRSLEHLGGHGVGIDHNIEAVTTARSRGFEAFMPAEFAATRYNIPGTFDSLLMAHVIEHMTQADALALLLTYLPLLRKSGQVVLITPQERGFSSDVTHVQFMDFETLGSIARSAGLRTLRSYSFPFPRPVGKLFKYNEFVSISQKP